MSPGSTAHPCAGDPVKVLVVGSGAAVEELARVLSHSRWELVRARDRRQATDILPGLGPAVVVSEVALEDGTWQDVLCESAHSPCHPPVIVAANQADDYLWMEVLNGGGYNFIAMPFAEREVFDIISMAWLRLRRQPESFRPPKGAAEEEGLGVRPRAVSY
jgi:DNA-binding NtrC family response regulator